MIILSPKSLERLARRRLLRHGITTEVDGGEVFFCEDVRVALGTQYGFNFFTNYRRQLRDFTNNDNVYCVLYNKVNRYERHWAWKQHRKYWDKQRADQQYRVDEAVGELVEAIEHARKIHVAVK